MNLGFDVGSIRSISWEIFGDEDLIFFLVFLAMPSIMVVVYVGWCVYKIDQRLGYATDYTRTQLEQELIDELTPSDDDDDNDSASLSLEEMLEATRNLNAKQPVEPLRLRRKKAAGGVGEAADKTDNNPGCGLTRNKND